MYERKNGDVSIFKNEKTANIQPDYRGTALIDGIEFSLSLWIKEGAKGKFMAGRIEPKMNKLPPKNEATNEETNDLPF